MALGFLFVHLPFAWAKPPEITATLIAEAAWQRARKIATLQQRKPIEAVPVSERTEVRVLTVAVVCRGDLLRFPPEAIVATRFDRDVTLESDDCVTRLFDPFLDRRNAFIVGR